MFVKNKCSDIVVVGGGPAGIMAAFRASELNAQVFLVEKTYRLGSKLLLTGGGRCNITNTAEIREFVKAFGDNGKFLYRSLSMFSNHDLIRFFCSRGLEMRNDPDGKVFPITDNAESVLAILRAAIDKNNVHILHNTKVIDIFCQETGNATVKGVALADGRILESEKVIISTGGISYPKTGSTGDGYLLAKRCGHTIVPLTPGLTALESDESFIHELQGLTLKNIVISVLLNGNAKVSQKGDILFTHFGVSGPTVLIESGVAVDALAGGNKVELSLNLRSEYSVEEWDRQLRKEIESCGAKTISQYFKDMLPTSFAPVFERRCSIASAKKCSMISSAERKRIATCFTDFRIQITKPRPIEEATITRGGITLKEINPQTMESLLVKGLYFCGEIIDVAGITGGYNLQEAFSTGYLAGESASGS